MASQNLAHVAALIAEVSALDIRLNELKKDKERLLREIHRKRHLFAPIVDLFCKKPSIKFLEKKYISK